MRRPVGYLVWNPARTLPTVQHETLERAEAEAERLRREHPDEMFWVMSPIKAATAAAKAFSDGKAEGLAQARAEIMLAESRTDKLHDEVRRLRREIGEFTRFRPEVAEHQATAADALLWFDGFQAAHAHREGYERPHTPDRQKLLRLNSALQRLLPSADPDFDAEIPF
jgi:hypothetical protein